MYYFQATPSDSRCRPLPYPFQGALALSSDAEFFSFDFFEALMQFMNTTDQTPLGTGVGLQVTSSIFFFSVPDYNFSYFKDISPSAPPGPCCHRLNEYLQSGWIDTNHAFGDFDNKGGFTRAHAEKVYETLESLGCVLPVFTNHGSCNNIQNVGYDCDYHRGDHPGHWAYHTDLFVSNGVRYVWTDTMSYENSRWASRFGWRRWFNRPWPRSFFVSDPLQDKQPVLGFYRLRGTGPFAPNLTSLGSQLQLLDWQRFYAEWGIVVIYQHLGVFYRTPHQAVSANVEMVKRHAQTCLTPFYFLAQEAHSGRLWVVGLSALLDYMKMIQQLKLLISTKSQSQHITLQGDFPDNFDFSGLTLYVEPRVETTVTFRGRPLNFYYNGPDQADKDKRYSITIPLRQWENIWT